MNLYRRVILVGIPICIPIDSCVIYQTGDIIKSYNGHYGIYAYDYISTDLFIINRFVEYNEF